MRDCNHLNLKCFGIPWYFLKYTILVHNFRTKQSDKKTFQNFISEFLAAVPAKPMSLARIRAVISGMNPNPPESLRDG